MIKDNYPASMSVCDQNGLDGRCGIECPLFQSFECKEFSLEENIMERITRRLTREDLESLNKK